MFLLITYLHSLAQTETHASLLARPPEIVIDNFLVRNWIQGDIVPDFAPARLHTLKNERPLLKRRPLAIKLIRDNFHGVGRVVKA